MEQVLVTVSLLVSNRIETIRACMESIKPLLDAVPSELIAVDTVGEERSDGSLVVVKEYTDQIIHFPWCNDFAAARNAGLERAKGEWFLYLDDDEVFEDIGEITEFFRSGDYKRYGAGYYQVKDHLSDGSTRDGVVGRMVKRTDRTRFVGRVHEAFNEVSEPFKTFRAFVHHYGYRFANEAEREAHQKRNVTLLKEELIRCGLTPRLGAQLMQELLNRKETADAGFEFFKESMKTLAKPEALADACTQWMLVASVRYFKIKKDYDGLLLQAEHIRRTYLLSQVAQLALAGVVIETSAPKGNVYAILDYAPMYKTAWQWFLKHPKEAIPQKQLDFTNYCSQEYAIQVFQAAATCANAVQEYKLAYTYWEMLPWGDASFDGSEYAAEMNKTLQGLEG